MEKDDASKNDNDEIDDIIYNGAVSMNPGEHDSFFASDPEEGQHFTVHEGQTFVREED
jgi:hypothetical protein